MGAAARQHWCQHQTDTIPDTPCRVLVDNRPGQPVSIPFQHSARIPHGKCQSDTLISCHAFQENGHRERADLRVA